MTLFHMNEGFSLLTWFFLFAFCVNGLVSITVLLVKNKLLRLANLLLGLNLLGISCISIMIVVVESRLILQVPHFYRMPSPLYYVMFPAAYLYVKLIVEDRTHLKRTEYLHFLPAILHLLEMLPYYLMSTDEKLTVLNEVFNNKIVFYSHKEGLLPAYLHNIIRGTLALIYCCLIWRLLGKFKDTALASSKYVEGIRHWLNTFTLINASIGLVVIFFLSATFLSADVRSIVLHIAFLTIMLITNFNLIFRPEILYGLPQPVMGKTPSIAADGVPKQGMTSLSSIPHKEEVESKLEIPDFIFEYKNRVHEYLMKSRRFLEPDYKLQDLARETGIPKHHLQLLIFKAEGKKFNEFMLDYRVENIKKLIKDGALKNKTLEALAAESGFSSKSAFIRSIKKLIGKTPKEYFIPDESRPKS